MSWIAPTPDDIIGEFTPSEVASINTLMEGGANITNRLTGILGRTVAEIRGYIRSGGYDVDANSTATVPPSLVVDTVAMSRWRFLLSVPLLKQLQTEDRKLAFDQSLKKLYLIADQKFVVEPPIPDLNPRTGNWNSENKILMRTHPVPRPATQFTPQIDTYANPDGPADEENTVTP